MRSARGGGDILLSARNNYSCGLLSARAPRPERGLNPYQPSLGAKIYIAGLEWTEARKRRASLPLSKIQNLSKVWVVFVKKQLATGLVSSSTFVGLSTSLNPNTTSAGGCTLEYIHS